MKKTVFFSMAAALAIGMGASAALAQNRPLDTGPAKETASAAELPGGTVCRYRVTYALNSLLAPALRSASIVSITNQNFVACRVAVDWRIGFGGIACASNFLLGAGQTADFCTRALPGNLTTCNSTPVCPNFEGNAIVGSATTVGCNRIAVSARTVYTSAASDSPVDAITDAKVVRCFSGNIGD